MAPLFAGGEWGSWHAAGVTEGAVRLNLKRSASVKHNLTARHNLLALPSAKGALGRVARANTIRGEAIL